ncbi:hypothetical protein [Desulfocurvibacter africanus]|uniref:hypothetical protein n=1 Tax=Desulfocurvibacter africanus TaxID=873 RepID=UPI00110C591A|nr:hypothetical protein [Desulfocurvibacter africanus]
MRLLPLLFFLIVSTYGCAATYTPSKLEPKQHQLSVAASKQEILSSVKTILVLEGYQLSSSDNEVGILTTSPRMIPLSYNDCDCGETMGIPYIKDNRTHTFVTVGVVAADNLITLKTDIKGEYLKNDPVYGMEMKCVSLGTLENELLKKIGASLPASK